MRDIFWELLNKIKDGMTFTLTEKDIAEGDHFLIFSAYKQHTITIHCSCPFWLEFKGEEPILLENCPTSFYETLLLNIEKGNYTNA